jgi:hypothetical protein
VNPAYLQAVGHQLEATGPQQTLSDKKRQFIMDNVKLQVSKQYQLKCLKLLLQNHEAVSQDKFDLGQTNTLMHEIALKRAEPIYVKQRVLKFLKLGVIQPAHSHYNSPIFTVTKKDNSIR